MDVPFFKQQMEKLKSVFGPDEYPDGRVEKIWGYCNDLQNQYFARIISHFIDTRSVKYPPLPTHFLEEAEGQRKIFRQQEVRNVIKLVQPSTEEAPQKSMSEILKMMGANSIEEAMRKSRKTE